MKANELRIGNLIFWDGEIYEVKRSFFDQYSDDEIKPIPLTEEWLLKFGFKETEKQTYEITDFKDCIDFCVSIYEDKVILTFWSDDPIYFRYSEMNVHQLQNLYFSLTGEELTLSE